MVADEVILVPTESHVLDATATHLIRVDPDNLGVVAHTSVIAAD